MNVLRIIVPLLPLPIVTALASIAGCKMNSGAAEASAATRPVLDLRKQTYVEETPVKGVQQTAVAVVQGPTPLVHIFDLGGSIRVVDLTSGARLLAVTVGNRTLVGIDDRNGVTIGSDKIFPGPLPPGHQYGIYLDPTTPNAIRRSTGPPGGTPQP